MNVGGFVFILKQFAHLLEGACYLSFLYSSCRSFVSNTSSAVSGGDNVAVMPQSCLDAANIQQKNTLSRGFFNLCFELSLSLLSRFR